MNALRDAIRKRRMGLVNPIDYDTEMSAEMEAIEGNGTDELPSNPENPAMSDIAPPLEGQSMMPDEEMGVAGGDTEIEIETPQDEAKLMAILGSQGDADGIGLKGKMLANVAQMIKKLKS